MPVPVSVQTLGEIGPDAKLALRPLMDVMDASKKGKNRRFRRYTAEAIRNIAPEYSRERR